jgi:ComF family protein
MTNIYFERTQRIGGNVLLGLKNLFLPAFCRKCGVRILIEGNLHFCEACWATIEPVVGPKCPRCGRPHSVRIGFDQIDDIECSECFGQKLSVGTTMAAGIYDGVLRDAIHLLKYRRKRHVAGPLGALLLDCVAGAMNGRTYDVAAPVPLHRNRVRQRGYNQSELIAEHLCRGLRGVSVQRLLRRVKDTPSFTKLGAQERRRQIKRAFEFVPGMSVKKKAVLLIDDVVTTGATTNECARVLRRAGAARVDVAAVAVARRLQ